MAVVTNTFVHIIMYYYFMLTALLPRGTRIWWKVPVSLYTVAHCKCAAVGDARAAGTVLREPLWRERMGMGVA